MNLFGSLAYSIQEGPGIVLDILGKNIVFASPSFVILSYLITNKAKKTNITKDLNTTLFILSVPFFYSMIYLWPSFRVLGRVSPDRPHVIISLVILLSLLFASCYFGRILRNMDRNKLNAVVLVASIFLFVSSFRLTTTIAVDIYTSRTYSVEFDDVYGKLKSTDKESSLIKLKTLPESGLVHPAQISTKKGHWINQAVEDLFMYKGTVVVE